MKTKYIYTTISLALVALLALGAVSAFPGNGFNSVLTDEEKTNIEEQRQEMQNAIENNDFESWKNLMQNRLSKMQSEITEENFQKMIDRHSEMQDFRQAMQEAKESGDYSKIQELKDEYGFEGMNKGMNKGMHQGFEEGNRMRQGSCPFADSE